MENTHLAPKNPEFSGSSAASRHLEWHHYNDQLVVVRNVNESYGDPIICQLRDLKAQLEIFQADDEDENNKYLADYGDAIYECDADDPAHRELVAVLIDPEPDAPPSDLPGLRAWKAARPTHSIIDRRRAAQALAASRIAAKVAQDKLETRASAPARRTRPGYQERRYQRRDY